MPLKDPWSASDRYVPRTVVQPLQRVLAHEAAGGVVMLIAAAVAIVWANSPWSDSYTEMWQMPLRVEFGGLLHRSGRAHPQPRDGSGLSCGTGSEETW